MAKTVVRLDKLLSSLGYCSRSRVKDMLRDNRVFVSGEPATSPDVKVDPQNVLVDGEELDPGHGVIIVLNKPPGYTCSHKEDGFVVYDLLPERFNQRNPKIATVGRLDKDSRGLLLLTDDGSVIHKLTSPKHEVEKVYKVKLRDALKGNEKELFASGTLKIEADDKPLKPARLDITEDGDILVGITEGRYHQVRRMFEVIGNEVLDLQRIKIGALELGDLTEGEWRFLMSEEKKILGL